MPTRHAGINIPLFSLRTKQSLGCGDFLDLIPLLDWVKEAGLKLIQLLPILDTSVTKTEKDSYPYSILSVFALHPIYMNIEELAGDFDLELEPIISKLNTPKLEYEKTYQTKMELIRFIYHFRGEKDLESSDFKRFFQKSQEHLKPYAAFCLLRDRNHTANFQKWGEYRYYSSLHVDEICEDEDVKLIYFTQYHLHRQFKQAVDHAHKKGVLLKGDFTMGVHPHSVEAWRFHEYFQWDKTMGAPPDYYNCYGQNWGFPTYNWDEIESEKYYFLKERLHYMEKYFDLLRIDHVLGYFRIWEIPKEQVRGLMGNFYPVHGYKKEEIPELEKLSEPALDRTQVEVKKKVKDPGDRNRLYSEIEDVCFFYRRSEYHPRVDCVSSDQFASLTPQMQNEVRDLHDRYFLERQDAIWEGEGRKKLTFMKQNTSMQLCAEDIGVIPTCTKRVLEELGILNLHVQRMPKQLEKEFESPSEFPKTCVCTPSNHDTATLREWWKEDREATKRYYHEILGEAEDPPIELTGKIAKMIIDSHLKSKATWAIFLLQDLLAMSVEIRVSDPADERINDPAHPEHQWKWRMPLYIEELILAKSFTKGIYKQVKEARR